MTEKKNNNSGGISRREFLKDAGLLVGGSAIGSTVLLAACGGDTETVTEKVTTTVTGAGETITKTVTNEVTKTVTADGTAPSTGLKEITLTINGHKTTLAVDPGWDLKHLLHDRLGCIGVKDMCGGVGACGACCVIIDGKAVLSCMTLAVECDGKTIENSEGIAASNHPIVDAFITNNAFQCGYCAPGFVVSAKALLDQNPNPTDDEIIEALKGNLCRCTSYPRMVPAVRTASQQLGGSE